MKLSSLGEFGLIDKISALFKNKKTTIVGIGDDTAILEYSKSQYLLVTTDALIEKVHFKIKKSTAYFNLGWEALAVSISDIAAMGGTPTQAVISLGLPQKTTVEQVMSFYKGIKAVAKEYGVNIIGGDTTASKSDLFISITLLGLVEKKKLTLRSTAKVGDLIYVTGAFGGAAVGKYDLSKKVFPRVKEGSQISELASAMIDSSDGLARSVREICKASRVGAIIREEQVPMAKGATLDQALNGGEEYELVFTVPTKEKEKIKKLGFKVENIGEIKKKMVGIKLIDKNGKMKKMGDYGYDHFKEKK